jgi:hypothetical protein
LEVERPLVEDSLAQGGLALGLELAGIAQKGADLVVLFVETHSQVRNFVGAVCVKVVDLGEKFDLALFRLRGE